MYNFYVSFQFQLDDPIFYTDHGGIGRIPIIMPKWIRNMFLKKTIERRSILPSKV